MKKFLTNRVFLNTVVLTLYTFIMEMYIRFLMDSTFQDFAVVRILLSSLIISLLWSWIWHFLKKVIEVLWKQKRRKKGNISMKGMLMEKVMINILHRINKTK